MSAELFAFGDELPTDAELTAIEFEAVTTRTREGLWKNYTICNEAVLDALSVLAKSKAELVDLATEEHDRIGPWMVRFLAIRKNLDVLADILDVAQARLCVAFAAVEGDDDSGGERMQ